MDFQLCVSKLLANTGSQTQLLAGLRSNLPALSGLDNKTLALVAQELASILSQHPSSAALSCLTHILSTASVEVIRLLPASSVRECVGASLNAAHSRPIRFQYRLLQLVDLVITRVKAGPDVKFILDSLLYFTRNLPNSLSQPVSISRDDMTQSEDDGASVLQTMAWQQVIEKALNTVETLAVSNAKAIYAHWDDWILCDPARNQHDILWLIERSPYEQVRRQAVRTLVALFALPKDSLRIANDLRTDDRQSFTAASVRVARTLRAVCNVLCRRLRLAQTQTDIDGLLRLAKRFVALAPFRQLREGLVQMLWDSLSLHINKVDALQTLESLSAGSLLESAVSDVEISALLSQLCVRLGTEDVLLPRLVIWSLATALHKCAHKGLRELASSIFRSSASDLERAACIHYLKMSGDLASEEVLREAVCDSLPEVRRAAVPAVIQKVMLEGDTPAPSLLAVLLEDQVASVRQAIWHHLADRTNDTDGLPDRVVDLVLAHLDNLSGTTQDEQLGIVRLVEKLAVHSLTKAQQSTANALVVGLFSDSQQSAGPAAETCRCLGILGSRNPTWDKEIVDCLVSALGSSVPKVKWNAAHALGDIAQEWSAVMDACSIAACQIALCTLLADDHVKLQLQVVLSLANFSWSPVEAAFQVLASLRLTLGRHTRRDTDQLPFGLVQQLPILEEKV